MQKNRIKFKNFLQNVSGVVMENLSYANIYNHIYEKRIQDGNMCNILELFSLKKQNDRYKYWVTKHLKKIYNTQRLGTHISNSDYKTIKLINKRAHLSMRLKLRKIQHKAIEHIWRPDGCFAKEISTNINDCVSIS